MSQAILEPQASYMPEIVLQTKISSGDFTLEGEIIVTSSTIDRIYDVLSSRKHEIVEQLQSEYEFYFREKALRVLPNPGPINIEFHHNLMGVLLELDGIDAEKALLALHAEVGVNIGLRIRTWKKEATVLLPPGTKSLSKPGTKVARKADNRRLHHEKKEMEATRVSISDAREIEKAIKERNEEREAQLTATEAERQQNEAVLQQIRVESTTLDERKIEISRIEQAIKEGCKSLSSPADMSITSRDRKATDIEDGQLLPHTVTKKHCGTTAHDSDDGDQCQFLDLTESTMKKSLTTTSETDFWPEVSINSLPLKMWTAADANYAVYDFDENLFECHCNLRGIYPTVRKGGRKLKLLGIMEDTAVYEVNQDIRYYITWSMLMGYEVKMMERIEKIVGVPGDTSPLPEAPEPQTSVSRE